MNPLEPFTPPSLPLPVGSINELLFIDELLEAACRLEIYSEKAVHSPTDIQLFLPSLWMNESLASSQLEGTQATLDSVLDDTNDQPIQRDKQIVLNYNNAIAEGLVMLQTGKFTNEFICKLHQVLMKGDVKKPEHVGMFRKTQNQIRRYDEDRTVTYTPPVPEIVPSIMNNLCNFMNEHSNRYKLLIKAAIIHAQFESIHPFEDGNGRIGRMLIPLFLYAQHHMQMPFFFISESIVQERFKYYALLNNVRTKGDWNEWIRFFLRIATRQSNKYITLLDALQALYSLHQKIIETKIGPKGSKLLQFMFRRPIFMANQAAQETGISTPTLNRYLKILLDEKILFNNENKQRYRKYYYYDLMGILKM